MRQIVWSHTAAKEFDELPAHLQEVIVLALARFAATGEGDVVRLQGKLHAFFRLRVGAYRVRFVPQGANDLLVLRVANRGEAYRE